MKTGNSISRAETTLFLLASADGKITSGESDTLDPDWDWKRVHGVKDGLGQYYQIEKTTDLYGLISAKVLAKLLANKAEPNPSESGPGAAPYFNQIVIDRKPWLTREYIFQLASRLKHLYLVTTNPSHPAHSLSEIENLTVISYDNEINFSDLFCMMKQQHGADRITIQSGGTLNASLIRQGLIDHLLIVVAPLLVGGEATTSIMSGRSLQTEADLLQLKALKLTRCEALADSFVRLEYDVIQDTVVDAK